MLADSFSITRRQETVGSDGRPAISPVTFGNLLGVITQEDPSELDRDVGSQLTERNISVVTQFAIRGEVFGYQPDLLIWNGTTYLITSVKPYSRFGAGFYEATAKSMTAVDVPQ